MSISPYGSLLGMCALCAAFMTNCKLKSIMVRVGQRRDNGAGHGTNCGGDDTRTRSIRELLPFGEV